MTVYSRTQYARTCHAIAALKADPQPATPSLHDHSVQLTDALRVGHRSGRRGHRSTCPGQIGMQVGHQSGRRGHRSTWPGQMVEQVDHLLGRAT